MSGQANAVMTSDTLFKVLNPDGSCYHGGTGKWHLPTADGPGAWMPQVRGALEPCRRGYHLLRLADILNWVGPALFVADYDGDRIDVNDAHEGKVVVRKARLLLRVETWNERTMRLFACDCAERALLLVEAKGKKIDPRSLASIAVARRFANGEATRTELDAAWDAAGDAAWDAERSWQHARLRQYLSGDTPPAVTIDAVAAVPS